MLDKLRAARRRLNVHGYKPGAIWSWNSAGELSVRPVNKWRIDFAHNIGSSCGACTYNNSVRVKKISDCSPFTKKFRIRDNVKLILRVALSLQTVLDPLTCIDRHRTLLNNDLV